MSILLTILAVLGVLIALGAAAASIANVRVSPLVVLGGLFVPLLLGVVTTRWSAESAVRTALEEGSVFTWISRAGPGLTEAWTAITGPAWVILLGGPLVVLLAAVGGAMRSKRRLVLAGVALASVLVCTALAFAIALPYAGDGPMVLATPSMLAVVGIPASVALLAGGDKAGPSAAGIGTVAAAAAVTATALAFIASSAQEVAGAIASAPKDMVATLAAGGNAYTLLYFATAVLPLATAIGLAAVGLGAGPSTGRATIGTVLAGALVPLAFIGADTSSAVAIGNAALGAFPALEPREARVPPAHWELPTVSVPKGTPGIELEAGGEARFIPAEGAPTTLTWPLSGDVILGLAPADGPSPVLLVDRAVPAAAVAMAAQAVRTGREGPAIVGVDAYDTLQGWPLEQVPASEHCSLVGPEMGCADGACEAREMPARLGPELCIHPQASWGLVVAAGGAVGHRVKVAFLPPEDVPTPPPGE